MGTLYNGIGLNTTESIGNRSLSNTLQLKGYAFLKNNDPANTSHLIYDKSAVTFQNQQSALVQPVLLNLPAGASISRIYIKNLSWGVNPNRSWVSTTLPNSLSVVSANSSGGTGVVTYLANIPAANPNVNPNSPEINTGYGSQLISANIDITSGYKHASLVNVGADNILTISSNVAPALTEVIVEVVILLVFR